VIVSFCSAAASCILVATRAVCAELLRLVSGAGVFGMPSRLAAAGGGLGGTWRRVISQASART